MSGNAGVRSEAGLVSPALSEAGGSLPLAWTGVLLALLQSICGALVALNGLRLAIGFGSLALASGFGAGLVWFHQDWIRLPMIGLSVVGAGVNLAVLAHSRSLRNKASAQWRRKPMSAERQRMERVEIALAVATFAMVAVEEFLHYQLHGGF